MTTHIGFTGTRHGMSEAQMATVRAMLADVRGPIVAHHGDCVGADAEFHGFAARLGAHMVGHLPVKDEHRAFCTFNEIRSPRSHFARNRAIVDESQIMIATPLEMERQTRGGTWYTVDYANKVGRSLFLVLRDGTLAPHDFGEVAR